MPGLYLHIPFCERKCVYCDFYSIESLNGVRPFLSSLESEFERYAELAQNEVFTTVFFGGGTPSLLDPSDVARILERLHTLYALTPDAEVTLETNPGTVDRARLTAFRAAGINRLSIGVQSFHPSDLQFLGRIHDVAQAEECIAQAADIFGNFSIDLIYALPGQQPEIWEQTLRKAIATGAPHISAYSLIVEEKTPLARMVASGLVMPLPADRDAAMYEQTMEILDEAGFEHYEISNYAKPGFRSLHNSGYWDHSPYLGFGPSAHSLFQRRRWWNISNLPTYTSMISSGALPIAGEETLDTSHLLDEAVMLSMRTGGIDYDAFESKYGVKVAERAAASIAAAVRDGLAVEAGGTLRLTRRGFLFCDHLSTSILAEF